MRTLKTVTRKALGIDGRFTKELKRQLGITALPKVSYLQMDATRMQFPEASFDFVYSFSVFEHLPDPRAAFDEVARVLRPGGGCYISLHHYTSENGCHDPRIFCGERTEIPYWSHLRPALEDKVSQNAFLNKIRVAEWKELICERMPGVDFVFDSHENTTEETLRHALEEIRKQGELADYSEEELLTVNLVAMWRKNPIE
jgi:ubiquinone/menaquinone biosynthesis C-methylase UbiE